MTNTPVLNSSVCSCPDCESMSCFTARSKAGNGCTCQNCKNSKTCLFTSNKSLNLKASKTDAYLQINTELCRTTDATKSPQKCTYPKIHTCCGKAVVGKLGKVHRVDAYKNNDKEEFKSINRKGIDTLHKIKFNDLYQLSHFDTRSVVDVEDDVHLAAILKVDQREQESVVCVKDNVSLFAMETSQCASACTYESNAPIESFQLILEPKSKEAPCETVDESNLPVKMLNVVNKRSVSASKSDTTKITDQIRIKLDAYDANKMNKVKSKFGTSKFVRGNAEVTKEQVQKEIVYESESDTNIEIKDSGSIQQDDSNQVQPLLSTVRSTTVSFSRSVTNKTSAARLSAQVMNVPFMEFQKSLSFDYSADNTRKPNILKYDILEKIKDVYKTCTCKVCECIASVGLSSFTEKQNCDCKPCECDECRSHRSPKRHPASYRLLVDDTHDYCNLNTNKGFLPKTVFNRDTCKTRSELCDCKPCECLDCLKYNYMRSISCDCKPCECIECKSVRTKKTRTLIVAPVGEDSQHRQYCQCSPCGCAECGFSYGHLSSNMTHDTGTSAYYRHTSCNCESCIDEACTQNGDVCICERRSKLMRKPVRSDKNDYDIHNVIVTNSNNMGKCSKNHTRNNDTVAMPASYSYASKPDPGYNNYNTNLSKEIDNISNMKNDCYDRENHRDRNVNCNNNKTGCYLSCSYNHCGRDNINNAHLTLNCCDYEETKSYKRCETFLSKINANKDTCLNLQGHSSNSDFDSDLSYRRLENKNNSSTLFAAKPWYLCKKSSTIENCEQNYKVFCMIPQQLDASKFFEKEKYKPTKMDNINMLTKTTYNVSKENTECKKCKETDLDTSESYTSAKSASLHPELLSRVKNSGFSMQMKRQLNKSSDSCNSSGHDNSDYLIQFPRCAIEACIKDVLNLGTHINTTSVKSGSSVEEHSTLKMPKQKDKNSSRKGIKTGQFCNAADCGNFLSNSNFKSQLYRCDCTACLYNELCIPKDSSLHINKTGETQTVVKGKDQNVSTIHHVTHTVCLGTLTEDIVRTPFKLSLEDVQDQNKVFSTNNCNFQVATSENTKNVLLNKLHDNNNALFTPAVDDTVQNTIKGAKQFSLELLELLHKYEKANMEFESVTEKLKMAQDAIYKNTNNNFSLLVSKAQRFEEPEKDQMELNKKEHSNVLVNDYTETPIKINMPYTTYYTANVQKDERPSEVFDSNGEILISTYNKRHCPVSNKELLLSDYSCAITPKSGLDINSKADLTNTRNTYKAYKKLIKKATRTTRHSNRNITLSSSPSKICSSNESKMISTKSQTKAQMEKETISRLKDGNDNGYSFFRNIEVHFGEMLAKGNVKHKKGNMNFKEDFECQVRRFLIYTVSRIYNYNNI